MAPSAASSLTAAARSISPSPLRSAATSASGRTTGPVEIVASRAKEAPEGPKIATVPASCADTAPSTTPSASKSPMAVPRGSPINGTVIAVKVPFPVFRRMLAVSASRLATAASRSPSPSRSPIERPLARSPIVTSPALLKMPLSFRSVRTTRRSRITTSRSSSPSPSKSPAASSCGLDEDPVATKPPGIQMPPSFSTN